MRCWTQKSQDRSSGMTSCCHCDWFLCHWVCDMVLGFTVGTRLISVYGPSRHSNYWKILDYTITNRGEKFRCFGMNGRRYLCLELHDPWVEQYHALQTRLAPLDLKGKVEWAFRGASLEVNRKSACKRNWLSKGEREISVEASAPTESTYVVPGTRWYCVNRYETALLLVLHLTWS